MKRILLAVLFAATPAFAHDRYDRDENDGWEDEDHDGWEQRRVEQQRQIERQRRWEEAQRREEEERWRDRRWEEDHSWNQPADAMPVNDFRNDSDLSANGRWIETPEYGLVWQPVRIAPAWQPYRYGRWAWTDAGWTWVSDEPFGWAVYHYGRWDFSPAIGWYWIPGRVWAPAWVEWRFGDHYAGWCALGPAGVAVLRPVRWAWVEASFMLESVPQHVVSLPAHFVGAMAPPVAGLSVGPPVRMVERAVGRAVVPIAAATVLDPRTAPVAGPRAASALGSRMAPVPGPRAAPVEVRPNTQPRAGIAPTPHPEPWSRTPHADAPRAVPTPRTGGWGAPSPAPVRAAPTGPLRAAPTGPRASATPPRTAPAPVQGGTGFWASRFVQPHAR